MYVQFSMGCRIWKPVAEELVKRGKRRVLAFDLFGRGYSDAAYPCDLSLFTGPSFCHSTLRQCPPCYLIPHHPFTPQGN